MYIWHEMSSHCMLVVSYLSLTSLTFSLGDIGLFFGISITLFGTILFIACMMFIQELLCSRLQINNPFIGDDGQFDRMITPQIPDLKNEAIQPHSNIVSNRTCQNCKNCYTKVWFHSSRYTITCFLQ